MDFVDDFGLRDTFQGRIVAKSIEIGMDKLHTKFLALNVDFDGTSFDFSRFKETCAEQQRAVAYPRKIVILPLQITMGMLPIIKSTSYERFSRIKIDDFKRP